MHRPTGVTVLAIMYLVGGGLGLVASCFTVAGGSQIAAEARSPDNPSSDLAPDFAFCGSLVFWIGLIGTGASLLSLGTGAGLWMLRPWGWRIALLRATVKLTTHLVAMGRGALTPSHAFGVLVNMAVLTYLSRPNVRQALSDTPISASSAPG